MSGNVRNWLGSGSKIYKLPPGHSMVAQRLRAGSNASKILKNKAHQDNVHPRGRLILEKIRRGEIDALGAMGGMGN